MTLKKKKKKSFRNLEEVEDEIWDLEISLGKIYNAETAMFNDKIIKGEKKLEYLHKIRRAIIYKNYCEKLACG